MKKNRINYLIVLLACFLLFAFATVKSKEMRSDTQATILNTATPPDSANPYTIIIDKSDYELKVYDEEGWLATYPVVFGSKNLGDKMKRGDKLTPDGEFKVILKKKNPKWGDELLLDYPNKESYRRFNERKKKGLLPKNADIGDGIAIHATRPNEEWTIDSYYSWTDGCISLKYTEMKDLYSYIPVGT
ncbi:MAG: L,D-transpeptidase, partial [Sphingobacteriales bacterium]|nr:L,D-transpeptidase [Sphingobacteriales bacterium]